jgi:cell division protein FtsW
MKSKLGHHPDYVFLFCLLALVVFGLVMLSSVSSDLGKMKFNDTYYYLKHQLKYGLSLGLLGFLITSLVYYRYLQKIAVPLLLVSLILLLLVFTPLGFRHAGANRWLNIGPFSLQPAELAKFAFIIYLAAWLSPKKGGEILALRQKSFFAGLLPFLIISAIVAFLILKQPSTTSVVIVLAAAVLVYFASGARLSYIFLIFILGVLFLGLVIYFTPYRFERVAGYLNRYLEPSTINIQSEDYHLNQSLIAIGSGGAWGVGFGKSIAKYRYLPESIGDSIFVVIAEELGFVGAAGLIAIFLLMFYRGFVIAKNSRDQFAKLIVIGFISVMAIQTFTHIAAVSGIIPLTGVPLPFISYGGTSLAVFLTMAGVIANISKYT